MGAAQVARTVGIFFFNSAGTAGVDDARSIVAAAAVRSWLMACCWRHGFLWSHFGAGCLSLHQDGKSL
jgi:hypothetical protein